MLGLGQAKLHHRDEAVPARQELRVILVLGKRPRASCTLVGEWYSKAAGYMLGSYRPALAAWMIVHTRSGVSGMTSM